MGVARNLNYLRSTSRQRPGWTIHSRFVTHCQGYHAIRNLTVNVRCLVPQSYPEWGYIVGMAG